MRTTFFALPNHLAQEAIECNVIPKGLYLCEDVNNEGKYSYTRATWIMAELPDGIAGQFMFTTGLRYLYDDITIEGKSDITFHNKGKSIMWYDSPTIGSDFYMSFHREKVGVNA